jgi:hypothetical protein
VPVAYLLGFATPLGITWQALVKDCSDAGLCKAYIHGHAVQPISAMKLEVKGQIFPKVWEIARSVKKLREERRIVNIGSGTMGTTVYEVELPEDVKKQGIYLVTSQGLRLYWNPGSQYESGYIISELDEDELAKRHFKK